MPSFFSMHCRKMAASKSNTYFLDVFLHFLPIPLLFYFVAFQDDFRLKAQTFLGRSVLVLYILLFSYISVWLGILYCIALIVYLQNLEPRSGSTSSADRPRWSQQVASMMTPVPRSPFVPQVGSSTPHVSRDIPSHIPISVPNT